MPKFGKMAGKTDGCHVALVKPLTTFIVTGRNVLEIAQREVATGRLCNEVDHGLAVRMS